MSKLTKKKANHYWQTDPNYRKASLWTIVFESYDVCHFVFYKLPWDDGSFPISNAMALGIWGGGGGEGEAVLSLPFSDGPKA